jgi:hypothetical protein
MASHFGQSESIYETAFAFWSSKVLLTAVQFGVFTKLGDRRITGAELGEHLGLHPRAVSDFLTHWLPCASLVGKGWQWFPMNLHQLRRSK